MLCKTWTQISVAFDTMASQAVSTSFAPGAEELRAGREPPFTDVFGNGARSRLAPTVSLDDVRCRLRLPRPSMCECWFWQVAKFLTMKEGSSPVVGFLNSFLHIDCTVLGCMSNSESCDVGCNANIGREGHLDTRGETPSVSQV